MEGLVDYVRRQIKCPECRAEHFIPYNGVQSLPNNVTLSKFLDFHRNVTGEEPEPPESALERCNVCSIKGTVTKCAHCDKKVCDECKETHLDVMRREIARVNNQIRRSLNRLTDALEQIEENRERLQKNSVAIKSDIADLTRRMLKDLSDKEQKLLNDLEGLKRTEGSDFEKLKADLGKEIEIHGSNCELIEKHVTDKEEWTDVELVAYRDLLLTALGFINAFDVDTTTDYATKIMFITNIEPDVIRSLIEFGELKIDAPLNAQISPSSSSANANLLSFTPSQSALIKSQSDHRLAAQFQAQQQQQQQRLSVKQSDSTSRCYLDSYQSSRYGSSALSGCSNGTESEPNDGGRASPNRTSRNDKYSRFGSESSRRGEEDLGRSRYLREAQAITRNWPRPSDNDDNTVGHTHFRSRFMRERDRDRNSGGELGTDDLDSDGGVGMRLRVRFDEYETNNKENVDSEKLFETDDVPKGPLSGLIRLSDSTHLLNRLHQNEVKHKQKEKEAEDNPPPAPVTVNHTPPPVRAPLRQISEDEIEKEKKQNQAVAASTAATVPPVQQTPPAVQTATIKTTTVPSSIVTDTPTRFVSRHITLQKDDEERLGGIRQTRLERNFDYGRTPDEVPMTEEVEVDSPRSYLRRQRNLPDENNQSEYVPASERRSILQRQQATTNSSTYNSYL